MNNTIFISYNPNSEFEQTLALRLHTIGAVNGFLMYLPDRYNSTMRLDESTKERIKLSDWMIVFTIQKLSNVILEEIQYAYKVWQDKSRIIIIYDALIGKQLNHSELCTEIAFDRRTETVDVILGKIMSTVLSKTTLNQRVEQLEQSVYNHKTAQHKAESERNGLLALLGIGVGLFALSAIVEDEEKDTKKNKRKSKKAVK